MTTRRQRLRSAQRGAVMLFTLIVLLILVIGSVALVRSMNNSLFNAGNLAFRRDLVNQGESAVANVITQINAGTFVNPTTASLPSANYSAQVLATNTQGVPLALLNNTTFATVGSVANDLPGATSDVSVRYVIDRLCSMPGTSVSTLCVQSTAAPPAQKAKGNNQVPPPTATVYRVSVRVSGARSTQIFLQTTFTKPD